MRWSESRTRGIAHLVDELALLRSPFGLPVYVTAWQSVPFSLDLVRDAAQSVCRNGFTKVF